MLREPGFSSKDGYLASGLAVVASRTVRGHRRSVGKSSPPRPWHQDSFFLRITNTACILPSPSRTFQGSFGLEGIAVLVCTHLPRRIQPALRKIEMQGRGQPAFSAPKKFPGKATTLPCPACLFSHTRRSLSAAARPHVGSAPCDAEITWGRECDGTALSTWYSRNFRGAGDAA